MLVTAHTLQHNLLPYTSLDSDPDDRLDIFRETEPSSDPDPDPGITASSGSTWGVRNVASLSAFVLISLGWAVFFFCKWRKRPRESAQTRARRFQQMNDLVVRVYRSEERRRLDQLRRQMEQIALSNGVASPPAAANRANRANNNPTQVIPPTPPITAVEADCLDLDDDETCVICLEPLTEYVMAQLPCSHVLHDKCIRQWMAVDHLRACPICRVGSLVHADAEATGRRAVDGR